MYLTCSDGSDGSDGDALLACLWLYACVFSMRVIACPACAQTWRAGGASHAPRPDGMRFGKTKRLQLQHRAPVSLLKSSSRAIWRFTMCRII